MFPRYIIAFVIIFASMSATNAQNREADFTRYICREWKLVNVTINGKPATLTPTQQGSSMKFWKNGTCEDVMNGEVQHGTWRYDAKKDRLDVTDRQTGWVLKLTIKEMQRDKMVFTFTEDKMIYRMEVTPVEHSLPVR